MVRKKVQLKALKGSIIELKNLSKSPLGPPPLRVRVSAFTRGLFGPRRFPDLLARFFFVSASYSRIALVTSANP
jgi:hypothetical protein